MVIVIIVLVIIAIITIIIIFIFNGQQSCFCFSATALLLSPQEAGPLVVSRYGGKGSNSAERFSVSAFCKAPAQATNPSIRWANK